MLLYAHPNFLRHETGAHPECPERLESIAGKLDELGLPARCTRPEWAPATNEQLSLVHESGYPARLEEFVEDGGGRIEIDTVVSRESANVARLAAGAVCDATARIVRGDDKQALCLVRPPGHHALPGSAMGFCLYNNVAVAARFATRKLGLDRVLIVDWDVHHGNGTQDMFYGDSQVGFLSIHRWPFYPGTGSEEETGTGDGLGATVNLPIRFGTSRKDYLDALRSGLEQFAAKLRPQLVILSAGFDAHRLDPVGSLELETEDYRSLTEIVQNVAAEYAGGRLVSALEGGYHREALAESVALHLETLLAKC
jgi:acetoin utilization deacetylase AcuC-like enzyme